MKESHQPLKLNFRQDRTSSANDDKRNGVTPDLFDMIQSIPQVSGSKCANLENSYPADMNMKHSSSPQSSPLCNMRGSELIDRASLTEDKHVNLVPRKTIAELTGDKGWFQSSQQHFNGTCFIEELVSTSKADGSGLLEAPAFVQVNSARADRNGKDIRRDTSPTRSTFDLLFETEHNSCGKDYGILEPQHILHRLYCPVLPLSGFRMQKSRESQKDKSEGLCVVANQSQMRSSLTPSCKEGISIGRPNSFNRVGLMNSSSMARAEQAVVRFQNISFPETSKPEFKISLQRNGKIPNVPESSPKKLKNPTTDVKKLELFKNQLESMKGMKTFKSKTLDSLELSLRKIRAISEGTTDTIRYLIEENERLKRLLSKREVQIASLEEENNSLNTSPSEE